MMVDYLKSPLWTTEVCNFIDEHCILFGEEEENSFAHKETHDNFVKLIDVKLDGFCAELGIEHEVFVQACSKISQKIHDKCLD